jgi:hypothetical protein
MPTFSERAWEVAMRVMSQLPDDPLTEREVRERLNSEYPFGRRRNWPYRVWLRVVRVVLSERFPKPISLPSVRVDPDVGVSCSWCHDGPGGCLACLPARRLLADLTNQSDPSLHRWRDWRAAAREDDQERKTLADWVDDLGFPTEADAMRRHGIPGKRKRKRKRRSAC